MTISQCAAAPVALKVRREDNVGVALSDIPAGASVCVSGNAVVARAGIPAGHKLALQDVGRSKMKYSKARCGR